MTNNKFDFSSTADVVLRDIDLGGKVVLITGGTSGLGTETARAMAAKGAEVTITARNSSKAKDTVSQIQAATGRTVEVGELELASLTGVRKFADDFLSGHSRLDILINNAGVANCPKTKTEDGIELQFGVNHIGHFLLTCLLTPALLKGVPSRVVNLSSLGHILSPVHLDDVNFDNREYKKWRSYGQSKTANVLFSVGMEKRLGDKGVHTYAVHPGSIQTNIQRHIPKEELERTRQASPGKLKTVAQGAATTVFAATSPDLEGKGGLYLADCQVSPVDDINNDDPNVVRSYAIDPDQAERLWALSESMVGQKFSF